MEVLLAVALEHFVLVVVRVLRGPTQADESAKKLRKLVHCQWCEERRFLKLGNLVDGELLNATTDTLSRTSAALNEKAFILKHMQVEGMGHVCWILDQYCSKASSRLTFL